MKCHNPLDSAVRVSINLAPRHRESIGDIADDEQREWRRNMGIMRLFTKYFGPE